MSQLLPTEQAYPNAKVIDGGILVFVRGEPPKSVQGYKQAPGERNTFIPLMKPCIHRSVQWRKVCGAMIQNITCAKFCMCVKVVDCLDCEDRKEKP